MWAFLENHIALILGFLASFATGLFAYLKAVSNDKKAKDEFLFGSLNHVVTLLREDNKALRERIIELENRIVLLEKRLATTMLSTLAGDRSP